MVKREGQSGEEGVGEAGTGRGGTVPKVLFQDGASSQLIFQAWLAEECP